MKKTLLRIDPQKEKNTITSFLRSTLQKHRIQNVVIGISGGIDSAVSLLLLKQSIPTKNIFAVHLPYGKNLEKGVEELILKAEIPTSNFQTISVKEITDTLSNALSASKNKVRLGNIIARVRMIVLFDIAKRINGLVMGTENKSEHLLGYFTRFGDEASDIEPIRHLFKTQVYQLGSYLGVPQSIIKKMPTAGLWRGQTDEEEFGFSYQEADQVLYFYYDSNESVDAIRQMDFPNSEKIIQWSLKNAYKHHVPYIISTSTSGEKPKV